VKAFPLGQYKKSISSVISGFSTSALITDLQS